MSGEGSPGSSRTKALSNWNDSIAVANRGGGLSTLHGWPEPSTSAGMRADHAAQARSGLAQETGLQHQPLDAIGVALDVLRVVLHQADAADHRPLLERHR